MLFIIKAWNAKVRSWETPGVIDKIVLGLQNEAGQRVLPGECTGHTNTLFQHKRQDSTHGHHQMVNTEIRLIISFAAKDGEALFSQQK